MNKLRILLIMLMCVTLVSGCARLIRKGYSEITISESELTGIPNIPIVKNRKFNEADIIKIGNFKVGDTGFTIRCTKGDVMDIVQREAKSQGADVVNIVWETGMNLLSSCYRVEVELIKFVSPRAARKYTL